MSKSEIEASIKTGLAVEKSKTLARKIFPAIANMDTVYDGQTVLNALAGYIENEIQKRSFALTVEDLGLNFDMEKESPIKDAVIELLASVNMERAIEAADMMKLMSSKLPGYLAGVHMKDKMETITIDQFIA